MKRLGILSIVVVGGISLVTSLGHGRLFLFVNDVPGRDLTAHFALMGMVCFFCALGFAESRPWGRPLGVLGCTLLVTAAVTAEELSQTLIPRRSFSFQDLLASYAGILVAAVAAGWIAARRRRRPRP